jgi:hypothetical protein
VLHGWIDGLGIQGPLHSQRSLAALRKEVREAKIAQGKGARLPVVCGGPRGLVRWP